MGRWSFRSFSKKIFGEYLNLCYISKLKTETQSYEFISKGMDFYIETNFNTTLVLFKQKNFLTTNEKKFLISIIY